MYYLFDSHGRYDVASETPTERSTEIAPDELTPDWNWNGINWVYAPDIQLHPVGINNSVNPTTSINHLEFMKRFTDTELETILLAAKTNISVECWLKKFDSAPMVTLTDVLTIEGVISLEAAGLLAPGRAAQILKVL